MLNIAICDDNIPITGKIEGFLEKSSRRKAIEIEVSVFWDGKELAEAVARGSRFDIIYLDIEMEKQDGVSAAKRIRIHDINALIIYVSSHENYMIKTFSVRPFRFLLKPINENELIQSFFDAYEEISGKDCYFRYSYRRINYKISIAEILYFESEKRKIYIVTDQNSYEMYGKLNDIEKKLKSCKTSFLRIHQSYLVNYKHVVNQAYDYVTMSNSEKLSISEDRRKKISEAYCMMEGTFHV